MKKFLTIVGIGFAIWLVFSIAFISWLFWINANSPKTVEIQDRIFQDKEFWLEIKNQKNTLINKMRKSNRDQVYELCHSDKPNTLSCYGVDMDTKKNILRLSFMIDGFGDNYLAVIYDSTDSFQVIKDRKAFGGDLTGVKKIEKQWYLASFT